MGNALNPVISFDGGHLALSREEQSIGAVAIPKLHCCNLFAINILRLGAPHAVFACGVFSWGFLLLVSFCCYRNFRGTVPPDSSLGLPAATHRFVPLSFFTGCITTCRSSPVPILSV